MADIYWPFPVSTVSEWPGARGTGWNDHIGTDFAVEQGTPLRATASGTVDIIWNDGLGAWVIDIYTPDGMVLRHGHLSAMYPRDGAWVNAGDVIGATGGRPGTPGAGLTTGPHLHWEIRNNGGWGAWGWYDPRNLIIKTFGAESADKPSSSTGETIEEDDEMPKNTGLYYTDEKTKKVWFIVANTGSGFFKETTDGRPNKMLSDDYMSRLVAAYDLAGVGFFQTTQAEANDLRAACAKVRAGV